MPARLGSQSRLGSDSPELRRLTTLRAPVSSDNGEDKTDHAPEDKIVQRTASMMSSREIFSETRSALKTGPQNGIGSDLKLSNKLLEDNKPRKFLQFNELSSSLPSYNNQKRQHRYTFCNVGLH